MYKRHEIGIYGEDIATKYLEEKGYKIIERNFTCKMGEIDIVAFDCKKEELVFVEVKTRTNYLYGKPGESVNYIKKNHIIKAVKSYIHYHHLKNSYIRIDVIEITLSEKSRIINHIKQVID